MNTIAIRYIDLKYGKISREDAISLRKDAAAELREIKKDKDRVYTDFPGVHGALQHSRLDVLDIREQKICAVIDNIDEMICHM